MTSPANISLQSGAPAPLRDLIWAEFFVSRGRGVSLSAHAPWLFTDRDLRSVTVLDGSGVAGGLVIKDHRTPDQAGVAMIGYVCVHPAKRGQHHSRLLLQTAIEDARSRGMMGVILWTQTPQIYHHFGFQNDTRDVFAQYPALDLVPNLSIKRDLADLNGRGLPAFATSAYRLTGPLASATILTTATGRAISEWVGKDDDVLDLLSSEDAGPWSINAVSTDSLLVAISDRVGPCVMTMPSARYVLPVHGHNQAELPSIRILDRI